MRAARLLLLLIATVMAAGLATSPASACLITAPVCIGSKKACHPSPAQQLANERRWSDELTRERAGEARQRLAEGGVDVAAELAELLIPNIRPIPIRRSDCGVEGEVDYGAGEETEDGYFRAVVAGSPLTESSPDEFAGLLRGAIADFSFGKACNTELRRRFAAYLPRAVAPAYLKEAWLFLSPRLHGISSFGADYPRLMRFEGKGRMPPVRWVFADRWLSDQSARSLERTRWGRAISAAIESFWAAQGPGLVDDSTACPLAVAEWARVRQKIIQQMLERRAARQQRRGSQR